MDKEKLSVDWAIELTKDILTMDSKTIIDKVRQLIDKVEKESWDDARTYYLSILSFE